MAEEKKIPLSIIIRTIDKATAGIKAVNERLDELTKPTREFGKALKELGEKSGLKEVGEAFKGVGEAGKEAFIKLLEGVAIVGELTHLLLEMVEGFASLNDTAERIGVSVDALSGLRYAASKSGASIEQMDQGLTTFVGNLGGLKAGTGKLTKFLGEVAPTMLTQLKATTTTEEALGILADGMAKLTNKSKQLKFAQEALGDPALAAVFHRGSGGIMELMAAHAKLAGSQQEAAERAAKVDDAMKDLHAATDGVKAALVTGLSPALTEIIDKLTKWLVAHREDVAKWAEDLGRKLPAAVDRVIDAVGDAIDTVADLVDGIGGLKVVAALAAASIVGPLVASIIKLSVVLLTTPVGWIITAIGLLGLAAYELIAHWDKVSAFFGWLWDGIKGIFATAWHIIKSIVLDFPLTQIIMDNWGAISSWFSDLWDGVCAVFAKAWSFIKPIVDKVVDAAAAVRDAVKFVLPGQDEQRANAIATAAAEGFDISAPAAVAPAPSQATIKVDFANAPKGTRVTADPTNTADVDLTVGYQMIGLGA